MQPPPHRSLLMANAKVAAVPFSQAKQYLGLPSACVTIILLMIMLAADLQGTATVSSIRLQINNILSPIASIIDMPMQVLRSNVGAIDAHLNVHEQNQVLKQQVSQLGSAQTQADLLHRQNQALLSLLKAIPSAESYQTAQVVFKQGGLFQRQAMIRVPAGETIVQDSLVLHNGAVAGRVVAVNGRTASILPIDDAASKLPVVVGETSEQGVLSGHSIGKTYVTFMNHKPAIAENALVVTANAAGIPGNIPVGRMNANGQVLPLANTTGMEWVLLVPPVNGK